MELNYHLSVLSNGIRVISSRIPLVESVAIGFWVGVGGRYESKEDWGASHFIEHLLFKGTKTRSARAISEAIEGRGGYFNAFTQEDTTCYYARISANHTRRVLDILADMYLNPRFSESDIDREKRVIIEEIMMYRDQPDQVVHEHLSALLWSGHPLGRPLIGSPENILSMNREQILGFKTGKYLPCNTVISLAGKVDHEACVNHLEKMLGGLASGRRPKCRTATSATRQDKIFFDKKPIEQVHFALGLRLFGRKDPRRFALKLMSVILGENMSSRLFQVVREKNGMAYSVHSGIHLYQDTGALLITAGLDRKRLTPACELISRELNRIKRAEVTHRELRRAKDYAGGQLRIGLEGTSNQMIWTGEHLLTFNSIQQPRTIIDKLEAVTVEDIAALADDIIRQPSVSAAMLTPLDTRTAEADFLSVMQSIG